ncbi:MAG TPA: glycosyltransferase family 39 protein [Vicinamibacterales bacterium]|nr:glycosyltransferase family 39 protein [Vicinamibacterales bacterium]
MRRSTIPVVLLAVLALVGGLGRGAIADNDEAFYAESAREMVESGDWLTPHFNYEPRFQKPALYYWVTAALFAVGGPHELPARLFAALSGVGLVIITTACGRRWYDESVGLLAGAIAATSFGYFALARMSLPDLPLAFFVTCSIWTAFVATLERERNPRQWLLYAATAAALGFLVKGPLAVVLPVIVVVPILLMERRSFNVSFSDLVPATLLFLGIALPWYAAMWAQHGTEYLAGFFIGDNFERFATDRFNDPRPWWFYAPIGAGGLLPWTPLALTWVGPVLQFLTLRRDVGTLDLRLLLWAALPLAFFTLSVGKQPRYILAVLPPLAVLLASSVIERTSEWRSLDGARRRPRPNGAVVTGCLLGALVLVALAALLYRAQPLFLNVSALNTYVVAGLIAAAGLAVVVVCFSSGWRSAPGLLAFAAAVAFAVLPYGVLSDAQDSTVVQMADRVRAAYRAGDAIGTYGVFVRNLVFYTGLKHTDLIHDEHLTEWLTNHERALVVMQAADADRLEADGLKMQRLGELPYFNEGGIRVRMLLWPDPATDLDTAVLVRIDRTPTTASRD